MEKKDNKKPNTIVNNDKPEITFVNNTLERAKEFYKKIKDRSTLSGKEVDELFDIVEKATNQKQSGKSCSRCVKDVYNKLIKYLANQTIQE